MPLTTEYEFTLPDGYVDREGVLHRQGVMRLATAADEILPMRDPRVIQNPSYLTVAVLSRVVTRLGSLAGVDTGVIEGLFARDLAFLNEMYQRLNGPEDRSIEAVCPECGCKHRAPLNFTQGA